MPRTGIILIVFLMLFIIFTQSAVGAINFYVGNQLIDLSSPLTVVNGSILVPITVFTQYLGARLKVDGTLVVLEFPAKTISMQLGQINVHVNGVESVFDVAPEWSNGDVMVPLRSFADQLGLRIAFDADQMALTLVMSEELEQLAGSQLTTQYQKEPGSSSLGPNMSIGTLPEPRLNDIVFLGGARSRVFIDVHGYTGYQSTLLTNPDRLVIDLTGITQDVTPTQDINNTIIQRIRSNRFNDRTMRIVFDLNKSTGYEIHRWPDGGLEVEFNYQISEIGYVRDEDPKLWFTANDQPLFSVSHLVDPARLVLDFQNSTLLSGAQEFRVSDPRVRLVRVSQFMPSITRVVLELDGVMTPISVDEVNDRFEILLFEGTMEEYNDLLTINETVDTLLPPIVDESTEEQQIIRYNQILSGRVVAIDPGHGGSDPGAIGPRGTFEKDVVLAIGLKLGKLLEEAGARVIYTRRTDTYISIYDRPRIAEYGQAEIFVSIHANSFSHQLPNGTEVLYNPLFLENFRLAQALQSELVSALQLADRGLRPREGLAVLNRAKMPAALVEVAFINHLEEELLLRSPDFQQRASEAIYKGIVGYFAQYR